MSRRGENIRKRKDGRWEGRYTVTDVPMGRSTVRSVYARTYAETKEKLLLARKERGHGSSIQKNGNIAEEVIFVNIAEEWFSDVRKSKKYSTYRKYRNIYEKYLLNELRDSTLAQLDEEKVTKVLRAEETKTISASLRKSILCVLNQILTYAMTHYHIEDIRFRCGKEGTGNKPVQILNHTEQVKLLCCLYEEMDIYKLGIILCFSTGLRLGEICALKWKDIDMREKMMYVNSTVQRIAVDGRDRKTVLMEGPPKSIFSKREIPISEEIVKLLIPYCNTSEYVVGGKRPMEPRTYQNKFQKYLKAAGIEHKNFHILRHTFATNCVASGADIKSLSEILGHSDVKITLNRYVHPDIETKRLYMNSLSSIYGQYMGQNSGERVHFGDSCEEFRRLR